MPTCALPIVLKAFASLFGRGELKKMRSIRENEFGGSFYILLPRYCSLRGNAEGGASSIAQFQESVESVVKFGINHEVLRVIAPDA